MGIVLSRGMSRAGKSVAAVVAGAAIVFVAGCSSPGEKGSGPVSPADAKKVWLGALDKTFDTSSASFKTYMNVDEANASKMYKFLADKPDAETEKVFVRVLRNTSMTTSMAAADGKTSLKDSKDNAVNSDATVDVDGAVSKFTVVGDSFYVSSDLAGFGEKTGLFKKSELEPIKAEVSKQMPWIADFLSGGTLKFDKKKILERLPSDVAKQSGEGAVVNAQLKKLIEDRGTVVDGGDDALGRVFTVDVPLKEAVKQASASMLPTASASPTTSASGADRVPGNSEDMLLKGLRDDSVLKLKSYVNDGKITRFEFDISQVKDWVDSSSLSKDALLDFNKLNALTMDAKLVTDVSAAVKVVEPANAVVVPEKDLNMLLPMVSEPGEPQPGVTSDGGVGVSPAPTGK